MVAEVGLEPTRRQSCQCYAAHTTHPESRIERTKLLYKVSPASSLTKRLVTTWGSLRVYSLPMDTGQHRFIIWPPHESFYIQAMLYSSRSDLNSIRVVNGLLSRANVEGHWRHSNSGELLNELQNVIVQGAALSRYFWPSRNSYEARSKFLRDALGVQDSSPLKDRELRNRMEHFDEKLADYLSGELVGNIFPSYVGAWIQTDVPTHMFRAYYIDIGQFEMLGRRYLVKPLVDEVLLVHERLEACETNGGRLQKLDN